MGKEITKEEKERETAQLLQAWSLESNQYFSYHDFQVWFLEMYDFYGSFWNTALRRKLYRKAKKHFNKVDRKRRGWVDSKNLIDRLVRTKVKTLSRTEINKLEA
eukprot:UN00014